MPREASQSSTCSCQRRWREAHTRNVPKDEVKLFCGQITAGSGRADELICFGVRLRVMVRSHRGILYTETAQLTPPKWADELPRDWP